MDMKYVVVKLADIDRFLDDNKREHFYSLLNTISYNRRAEGRQDNRYIVINTDEPYAPEVIDILRRYGHWGPGHVELSKSSSISVLVQAAHQNAIDKGWYEEPRTFGELIALMHSELSEALEDHRNGHGIREIWYEGDKPCGIPTELADVVIRIFDACGHLSIDLEEAIRIKMAYNATRERRHGGKVL